jgi:hypothetical protein
MNAQLSEFSALGIGIDISSFIIKQFKQFFGHESNNEFSLVTKSIAQTKEIRELCAR